MSRTIKKGKADLQPSLFSTQSENEIETFRKHLLEILEDMKVETDSPLLGWWTERNATLDLVIKAVKGISNE